MFITPTGFHIEVIFDYDTCINMQCALTIFTENYLYAGSYELQYAFFFTGMPDTRIYSNIFVVIVINPCLPPPGCIGIPGCGIDDPTVLPPSVNI